MPNSQVLTDQELFDLTNAFQPAGYSKDRALELIAAGSIAMIIEPGDQMAGALARALGGQTFLDFLIEGLPTVPVIKSLRELGLLDELMFSFGNLEQTLSDSRQRWLPRLSKSRLEHLFRSSQALGLKLLTKESNSWPQGLNDLQDAAPAMLFVEGNQLTLGKLENAVSVVGSRACTSYGEKVCTLLIHELCKVQRPTVSGGAVGIDAAVHRASVSNFLPTVSVMAGGLDRKYPKENMPLFANIKQHGALVSELPPGVAPTRWRFLQRNRLIAALTPKTIVVEAGIRSGSIRTANNALELDRDLYAVPGSVFSATSKGTNQLIGQGKALALTDFEFFASGNYPHVVNQTESALAQRAKDAIRESRFPTKTEISKIAGLTEFETTMALTELLRENLVIEDRGSEGSVHYALKYAH